MLPSRDSQRVKCNEAPYAIDEKHVIIHELYMNSSRYSSDFYLFFITMNMWKKILLDNRKGVMFQMMAVWKVQIIEQWFSLFEDWHWISLDWCQSDFFVDPLRYSIEKQKEERARKGSSQVSAARIPLVSRRKMRFFFFADASVFHWPPPALVFLSLTDDSRE